MTYGQTVTYDSTGHIAKIVKGFGDHGVLKKSKYMVRMEEEERIKELKRKNRKK